MLTVFLLPESSSKILKTAVSGFTYHLWVIFLVILVQYLFVTSCVLLEERVYTLWCGYPCTLIIICTRCGHPCSDGMGVWATRRFFKPEILISLQLFSTSLLPHPLWYTQQAETGRQPSHASERQCRRVRTVYIWKVWGSYSFWVIILFSYEYPSQNVCHTHVQIWVGINSASDTWFSVCADSHRLTISHEQGLGQLLI